MNFYYHRNLFHHGFAKRKIYAIFNFFHFLKSGKIHAWLIFLICLGSFSFSFAADAEDSGQRYFRAQHIPFDDLSFFTRDFIYELPLGSHTGSIIESVSNPGIFANADTGGFALAETPWWNIHGGSILWQKFWLNGLDITNPALPGRPFIDIPKRAWDAFGIHSILSSYHTQGGFNFFLDPFRKFPGDRGAVHLTGINNLGGAALLPRKTLDREPAMDWGAPEKSRHFAPSFEGDLSFNYRTAEEKKGKIFLEGLAYQRNFLPLGDELDKNQRYTLVLANELPSATGSRAGLLFIYQNQHEAYAGIERSFVKENTLNTGRDALYLQLLGETGSQSQPLWKYGVGIGYAQETSEANGDVFRESLWDEIHSAPLPMPQRNRTLFLDLSLSKKIFMEHVNSPETGGGSSQTSGEFSNKLRLENVAKRVAYPANLILEIYQGSGLNLTIFDQPAKTTQNLVHYRPAWLYTKSFDRLHLEAMLGAALESAYANGETLLWRGSAEASLGFRVFLGSIKGERSGGAKKSSGFEIYAGLSHEALPLTIEEARFLDRSGLSGNKYTWNDWNNDLLFQENEKGQILERSGALYHNQDPLLKNPLKEEFSMGFAWQFLERWKIIVQSTARWYRNLYLVRYDPSFVSGYVQVARPDNQFTGYLYDRLPGSYGAELYQLTNDPKDAYYLNLEFNILRQKIASRWFIQASLTMHYGEGSPPPGNGPEYNDPGIFNESTASANNTLANRARLDYDRGYVVNIIFGGQVSENISFASVVRYRDGEPFGQYIIAEGLSQGPVPVQVQERSEPPYGMPRYTYALSWDLRIKAKWNSGNTSYGLFFDIYNLLNSRTEIQEMVIAGEKYRDPLETYSPRSFRAGLSFEF